MKVNKIFNDEVLIEKLGELQFSILDFMELPEDSSTKEINKVLDEIRLNIKKCSDI